MAPQFVKPYVVDKNDSVMPEAIAEAGDASDNALCADQM